MTEIEKVEKLCDKTNVTFADAKDALDKSGGDVLDALIYLEKQGKTKAPEGGFYTGAETSGEKKNTSHNNEYDANDRKHEGESFSDMMNRFGSFCTKMAHKSVTNYLEASKDGRHLFSIPVLVIILLLCVSFWIAPFVFVITLFFGFRYRFTGEDLGKDSVNSVMDSATDVVEDVKRSFNDSTGNTGSTGSAGNTGNTGNTNNKEQD